LDCEAINVAVAHSMGVHRVVKKEAPEPEETEAPAKVQELPRRRLAVPRRSGWVKSW
jgi:hypothetical protein